MPLPPARLALPRHGGKANGLLLRHRSAHRTSFSTSFSPELNFRRFSAGRGVNPRGRRYALVRPDLTFIPSSICRSFSSTGTAMATKIDGTAIAKSIRGELKAEIEKIQESNPRFKPNLVIFQGMLSQNVISRRELHESENTDTGCTHSWR